MVSEPSANNGDVKVKDLISDDMVKMLSNILECSPLDISPDDNLINDLNLDSLQMYELVVDLEDVYSIRIPDESLDTVKTVSDAVELVYALVSNGSHD